MTQARRWRITFEVEFPFMESRTSVWRWFHRFSRWLESKGVNVLIRIEPVNPEPELEEGEVADFYEEVGI